jgi:hypothetical protein
VFGSKAAASWLSVVGPSRVLVCSRIKCGSSGNLALVATFTAQPSGVVLFQYRHENRRYYPPRVWGQTASPIPITFSLPYVDRGFIYGPDPYLDVWREPTNTIPPTPSGTKFGGYNQYTPIDGEPVFFVVDIPYGQNCVSTLKAYAEDGYLKNGTSAAPVLDDSKNAALVEPDEYEITSHNASLSIWSVVIHSAKVPS